jgi:hypothetical protein
MSDLFGTRENIRETQSCSAQLRTGFHWVTGDVTWAYLKGLLAGLVRRFIYDPVTPRPWKVFVFEKIKRALVKK